MRKLLSLFLIGVAAAGCSSHLVEEVPVAHPYDIHISSGVDASTASKAAAVAAVTDLTAVQFLMVNATTATLPTTKFTGAVRYLGNRAKGATMPIVFTDAIPPRYTFDDKYAYIKAYHPAGTINSTTVTIPINGKSDILLSNTHAAGRYSVPLTTAMTFQHVLAQLEVICVAATTMDGVTVPDAVTQAAWGTITSIQLMNTLPTCTYTLATDAITFTGTAGLSSLFKADYETALAPITLAKVPSPAISAAGMFAPVASGTALLTLLVKTSKVTAGIQVPVQLKSGDTAKGFEVGKKHTVTLTFNPDKKNISVTATTITAWGAGYTGAATVEK